MGGWTHFNLLITRRNIIFLSNKTDVTVSFLSCFIALEFDGADAKALYRRALAREKMENYNGAVMDARSALRLEPKNR